MISKLLRTFESSEDGSLITNRKTQSVSDLTKIISQLKQVIEDQSWEILELKKRLNELTSTKKLYQEQLRRQLLDDQQNRVKLVVQIAKRERGNVYNDITSLIENQERFG